MKSLLSALLLLSLFLPSIAQDAENGRKESIFDRLESIENPQIRLETNLDSIVESRWDENYEPALFTISAEGYPAETWNIEIRNRARYRRRKCGFPPIKLKFPKDSLKALGMAKHNELKLVTHCLETSEGEENLREEYLVYKLYEQLSPAHYRAKLIDITYVNTVNGKELKRQALILEDEKELAKRLNSDLCEDCYGLPDSSFNNHNLQVQSLYQYMIGNPDWSIVMLRNLKLLQPEDGSKFLAVPYDFDFSGMVNASYALPDPILEIESVRERKLMGPFGSFDELEEGIAYYRDRKDQILQYVEEFPYLRKSEKRGVLKYLKSFFNELKDLPPSGDTD